MSNRTLILALSTTCHFCTESAPLYQRIAKLRVSGTRIIAVLPQDETEGRAYLAKLGVSVDQIYRRL